MTEKELIAGMKRETGGDACFRELYESLYPPPIQICLFLREIG